MTQIKNGFTLIELSIVLVIIGLLVGGILVGSDLIKSSGIRSTLSQKAKYDSAVNAFDEKYGGLPGDISDPAATRAGLLPRGIYAGQGDGNGLIEGSFGNAAGNNFGSGESAGETVMFWVDLSTTGFIEETFNTATPNSNFWTVLSLNTPPLISSYLPQAKLGGGVFFYVYSFPNWGGNNNYYALSAVTSIYGGTLYSNPGLSVLQAYNMDKKIDDGLPLSGKVAAYYLAYPNWPNYPGPSGTSAYSGSATSCYDNGGVANTTQQYSLSQNNGAGLNCGLSFKTNF